MRTVVAIVVAGIAIVALAIHFSRSAPTAPAPASARVQPQVSSHDAGTATTNASAPRTAPAAESSAPVAVPLTEDERQQALCDEMWKRKTEREQAARDAESKDPAWAYQMEQKLREYTSARLQSSQVDVIDCKTTFCEITTQDSGPDASADFNRAIDELAQDPSKGFTGTSVSHTEEAGKVIHVARVDRRPAKIVNHPPLDKDQQACWDLSSRRAQQQFDAREAQPRDAGWADPMEQLLRQHIIGQLVKHPPDRLEINCKTTFCQIKATGRTKESQAAFQKVSQEVAAEPWADLRVGEGGSGSYGDIWRADVTLYRNESQ